MAGFLKSIQRKDLGAAKNAANELVRERKAESTSTEITTTDESLGESSALLAELQAESQAIVDQSQRTAEIDLGDPSKRTQSIRKTRVKIIDDGSKKRGKSTELLDDSMPWWLTDPPTASPQVDLLVPEARRALNDILSEEIKREDLPIAIRQAVNRAATNLASEVRLSTRDIDEAVDELLSLMMGKGPLQPLYEDPGVTDIHLDTHDSIKCIRRGHALETPFRFRSGDEYEAYINNMLQSVDRVLNLSSPIVDCVLEDKWRSRINAVHHSLLDSDESSVVVRVPRLQQITFYDLLQTHTLPPAVAAWLSELVGLGEANILVIGPTGSGKTVFTTALLSAVGSDERIVTIEDVPEIFVPTAHIEKLVTRPDNAQGNGAVGMHELLRAALRRAPHRIVVGEIRDKEGPLFLKALETGHAGSVATIHAHNSKEGLWRLLDVVAAYEATPQESLQRRISRSVNILITMKKVNGRPCMVDLSEVRPPIKGEFIVQQLVSFETERDGKRYWRIGAAHSKWLDAVGARGMRLAPGANLLPMEVSLPEHDE
ncbi:MAG: CpaF family protein [Bdellovibrionales bacterium]|nr:CpaF family protein [Bdellovibrionales bacterium]